MAPREQQVKLATMTSVCPDWDLPTIVEGMLRHGYAGLEPRVGWGHRAGLETDLPAAARAEARRRLEDAGLAVCCVASGARFAATAPAERRACLEETRRCIELAADLGCPLVRTFGGPQTEAWQLHHYVEHVVEGYREVLPEAAAAGVTLLLETHDDWSASAPVRTVVERCGHPNLRVLWDFMHTQRMLERPADTCTAIGTLTAHVHAHDGAYRTDDRQRIDTGTDRFRTNRSRDAAGTAPRRRIRRLLLRRSDPQPHAAARCGRRTGPVRGVVPGLVGSRLKRAPARHSAADGTARRPLSGAADAPPPSRSRRSCRRRGVARRAAPPGGPARSAPRTNTLSTLRRLNRPLPRLISTPRSEASMPLPSISLRMFSEISAMCDLLEVRPSSTGPRYVIPGRSATATPTPRPAVAGRSRQSDRAAAAAGGKTRQQVLLPEAAATVSSRPWPWFRWAPSGGAASRSR